MTSVPTVRRIVQVRYFAAAAEAAGTAQEDLELPAGATAHDLVSTIRAAHGPQVERVLAISSLLIDDVVHPDRSVPLRTSPDNSPVRVDVLPPFAGG